MTARISLTIAVFVTCSATLARAQTTTTPPPVGAGPAPQGFPASPPGTAAPPESQAAGVIAAPAPRSRPAQSPNGAVYAGAAIAPLEVTGLSNIEVTDFFPGALEGRVGLDLGSGNTSGMRGGLRLGYEMGLQPFLGLFGAADAAGAEPPPLSFLGEVGLYPGRINLFTLALGADVSLFQNDVVTLGLLPKVGYAFGFLDLGSANLLPDKTSPVVTSSGVFFQGDSISATISGFLLQLGAVASFDLTSRVAVRLDAGYQLGLLNNFTVNAGSASIASGSPNLVQPGTFTPASVAPRARANGPCALLAVTFTI